MLLPLYHMLLPLCHVLLPAPCQVADTGATYDSITLTKPPSWQLNTTLRKQQLAAAVGSGSAGTWRFPPSPDFAAYALVRRGPELALYRNGARMEAASEAGPADDGMLFSNPPAVVNPDGAWTGSD